MKHLFRGIVAVLMLIYPFLVGWCLSHGHLLWVSLLLLLMGISRLLSKGQSLMWPLTGFAILCGGLSLILQDQAWLKLYPVLMSVGALVIFAMTLIRPPSMIERFARLAEPDLPESGMQWTKRVTQVWCGFFALNAMMALVTVLWMPMKIWILYNGFISYLLMGCLFLGEFMLRKRHQRLQQKCTSLCAHDNHNESIQ